MNENSQLPPASDSQSDFQPASLRCECHGVELSRCPARRHLSDGPKPLRYVPNPDGLDNPNDL